MARNVLNGILSCLSTAVFFATFVLVGDVLVAATAAVATAVVQFVVRQSVYHRTGVLMWASLALVIALTGLSLTGDDAFASTLSQAQMSRQMSGQTTVKIAKCGCHLSPQSTVAKLSSAPVL